MKYFLGFLACFAMMIAWGLYYPVIESRFMRPQYDIVETGVPGIKVLEVQGVKVAGLRFTDTAVRTGSVAAQTPIPNEIVELPQRFVRDDLTLVGEKATSGKSFALVSPAGIYKYSSKDNARLMASEMRRIGVGVRGVKMHGSDFVVDLGHPDASARNKLRNLGYNVKEVL